MKEGKKNDFIDGKLRWDLLPLEEIEDVVKVYTAGSKKYGDNTWQLLDNGYHGNKIDEETGCQHLSQVVWNVLALLWLDKHGRGKIHESDEKNSLKKL